MRCESDETCHIPATVEVARVNGAFRFVALFCDRHAADYWFGPYESRRLSQ